MNRNQITLAIALFAGLLSAAVAGPREDLLARYATGARAADAGFSTFSAIRGESLHRDRHGLGKPDTPSCTACHAEDPRQAGRTRSGKAIDPVAVSVSHARYTDAAKVEKWFKRNCTEVLGRECTPREKGDWITYMMGL
ncbi:MAG: DUF1924 domain-containing protein [Azoarcus sp.]|nr:DUF1924 domain-containing protein [Azoarcus sp.]